MNALAKSSMKPRVKSSASSPRPGRPSTGANALALLLALQLGSSLAFAGERDRERREGAERAQQAAAEPSALQGPRRSVAVARFEGLLRFEQEIGGAVDVGGGLAAMLTSALQESGAFLVVERPGLADALAEQRLGANRLTRGGAAAQPGELLGAEWLVTGHVTEFSQSDAGRGMRIGVATGGGLLGLAPKKRVGSVAVDVRIVDPSSGRVVLSITAREQIKSRSVGLSARYGDLSLGDAKFRKTPLGQAARAAISQVVAGLVDFVRAQPWSGRVVSFDSNELVLNAGRASGMEVGQALEIYRELTPVVDPRTGELLGHRKSLLGRAQVTWVEDRFATCVFEGEATPRRDDLVVVASAR